VYHGTRYIDEVISQRLPAGRVYVHQAEGDQCGSLKDWNVTALTDLTGRVLERNWYSPYGELEVVHEAHPYDYDADGDVDSTDVAAANTGGLCRGDYDAASGDCKRLDADADGDVDGDDYTAVSAYASMLPSDGKLQRVPVTTVSRIANSFAHQGLVFDTATGSYQNRSRQLSPILDQFFQRDPQSTLTKFRRTRSRATYTPTHLLLRGAPYSFLDPTGEEDESALLYICGRPVTGFPGVGNHGYLWDSNQGQSCGMDGSCGSDCQTDTDPNWPGGGEKGPYDHDSNAGGDCCNAIPATIDQVAAVMQCCKENANSGFWLPFIQDCHRPLKDCLAAAGLPPTGAPGGHLGDSQGCKDPSDRH
jgi:hypothetical protein